MSVRKLPPRRTSTDRKGDLVVQVFIGAIVIALALLIRGMLASYVYQ